ncbi:hypothetical protein QVD17_42052 [Tagetes erecta]|uniref:Uncharacterized protein n=1 Tax=Tagetes erecta TaxID=13708 RepID=A0AAD8JNH8_TARER|nr:hypothetical protein QVD17_42052 [Tagetes erecta]
MTLQVSYTRPINSKSFLKIHSLKLPLHSSSFHFSLSHLLAITPFLQKSPTKSSTIQSSRQIQFQDRSVLDFLLCLTFCCSTCCHCLDRLKMRKLLMSMS